MAGVTKRMPVILELGASIKRSRTISVSVLFKDHPERYLADEGSWKARPWRPRELS